MMTEPLVSIVMPTFNRAHFLHDAFQSIQSQRHSNWQLIIVDDGSADETEAVVNEQRQAVAQTVLYLKQANQGPAAARNEGLKHVKGDFIAFYDSDDLWLPHHLSDSLERFQRHPQLDWIYSSCRRITFDTQEVLQKSTFYLDGEPNCLFSIGRELENKLYQLDSALAVQMQIIEGIDSGLQNSVTRARVFDSMAIPNFRIGEDRLLIAMVLKRGFQMGFVDQVSVLYRVHDGNISDTNASEENLCKRVASLRDLIASYQRTPEFIPNLTKQEQMALNKRIADDMFWKLGYSILWQGKKFKEALNVYKQALKRTPSNPKFIKTYLLSLIRYWLFLATKDDT